jgi:hypothetical protein
MQDIVPKGGRSIRNIPLPETRKPVTREVEVKEPKPAPKRAKKEPEQVKIEKRRPAPEPEVEYREESSVDKETLRSVREEFESRRAKPRSRRKGPRSYKGILIAVGVIAVLGLAIVVSNAFHGATLQLTPRTVSAMVDDVYTAKKLSLPADLNYETVTIKQSGSETVKATGERQVDKKATGVIVIYNNYNSSPQRLIKNTRFATPEGLIYRITDSVTVPGKKGTVPGSVEATVTADQPGESYNVGLKDFTIPGFKGDPRYTAFYARSKTPLSGGFSGIQKIVADADRAKAKSAIESRVETELVKQIVAQIPEDKVFFPKGYTVDFVQLPE